MSDDLILHARLELLRANLRRAAGVPEVVDSQRSGLAQLLRIIDRERNSVGHTQTLKRHLQKIRIDLEGLVEDSPLAKEAFERLDRALASVGGVEDSLDEAWTIVQHVHQRRVLAAENLKQRGVMAELETEAEDFISEVDELMNRNGPRPEANPDVWHAYSDLLRQIGPRFDECVDLLQGVSAREHALEEDSAALFELADMMIRSWDSLPDFRADSFAIPSRREVEAHGRINVVRMGFSEWTVWTLPLVAFEFGRLVVYRSQAIQDYLTANHSDDVVRWGDLMAEAIATAALGPAYACAAIMLRLEPPGPDGPADHDRARTILLMLEALNQDNAFDDVVRRLRSAWAAATRGPVAEERPETQLRDAVVFLARRLRSSLLVYPVEEFQSAAALANDVVAQLAEERHPIDAGAVKDDRNLMNLAWLCRLQNPAVDQAKLAARVLEFWRFLLPIRRGHGRPGSTAVAGSQRGGGL